MMMKNCMGECTQTLLAGLETCLLQAQLLCTTADFRAVAAPLTGVLRVEESCQGQTDPSPELEATHTEYPGWIYLKWTPLW